MVLAGLIWILITQLLSQQIRVGHHLSRVKPFRLTLAQLQLVLVKPFIRPVSGWVIPSSIPAPSMLMPSTFRYISVNSLANLWRISGKYLTYSRRISGLSLVYTWISKNPAYLKHILGKSPKQISSMSQTYFWHIFDKYLAYIRYILFFRGKVPSRTCTSKQVSDWSKSFKIAGSRS